MIRFKGKVLVVATLALAAVLAVGASACGGSDRETLTIYAGRSSTLVGPLLDKFADEYDINVKVRYGDGTDLALGILEEGDNSPADVYYGQDVGAFGVLKAEGRLSELPQSILDMVGAGVPLAGRPVGRHLRPPAGHRLQHGRHRPFDAAGLDPRLHRPGVEGAPRHRAAQRRLPGVRDGAAS